MNKDTKKELIKEAIREYQHEDQKSKKKKIYHNTELLMKHYNELKQHVDNAVYKAGQVFMTNKDELEHEGFLLDSEIGEILKWLYGTQTTIG